MSIQKRNILLWHLTTFLGSAAFALPIWVLFNTEVLGLTNAQAFLLGTVPYGVSAFFEIPTGSWADKYGRARVYQWGTALFVLSFASYLLLTNFWVLLLFQLVGAIGIAMQSGCREALVHDSITLINKDEMYAKEHSRNHAIIFVSRVITVLVGGAIYLVNPRGPFLVGTVVFVFGLILSWWFKEVRVDTPTELSSWNHIKETWRLVWGIKTVVVLLAIIMLYRIMSESLFSLYQPYFRSLNISVGAFGTFYAVISIFSALGSLMTTRALKKLSPFQIIFCMLLAIITTLAGMLLRVPWFTYVVIIPSAIAFGFAINIMNTSIQKVIRSRHQATALSIASFLNTTAFLAAAVSVGVMLDYWNVQQVNLVLVLLGLTFLVPVGLTTKLKFNSAAKSKVG